MRSQSAWSILLHRLVPDLLSIYCFVAHSSSDCVIVPYPPTLLLYPFNHLIRPGEYYV